MKCKLCGKEKPLIKAHIIPRCFFEIAKFEDKSPALTSNAKRFGPLRRRIGIYDLNILCRDCEDKFERPDDYACKRLLHGRDSAKILYDNVGKEAARVYSEIKYPLIRKFFLSVLLRAELSTDFFFQHVKLGPYRKKLIEHFNGRYPITDADFSVFAFYYPELGDGPLMLPPDRMRICDVTFYHFHLGRIGYCVKVDRRPCPNDFKPILLREGKPLVVLAKEFRGTQLARIVSEVVQNERNREYFAT